MSFGNPAGLLALLGVPVLILIYIIKSRREERSVSSTFIWRLSERFLKKRIPLQRFRKLLLFILQMLSIILVAMVISRPTVKVEDSAKDYIVVLDASGSMMTKTNGETRFERAVGEIHDLADKMSGGSRITIVYAGNEAYCAVKRADTANSVKNILSTLKCDYGAGNLSGALEIAQKIYDEHPEAQATLYTDKNFETAENIEVKNLSDGGWNAAVTGVSCSIENGRLSFVSTLVCYGTDTDITAALIVDGEVCDAVRVPCKDGTPQDVTWKEVKAETFDSAQVVIEADDSLESDNTYNYVNPNKITDVLLVGKSVYFWKTVLSSFEGINVKTAASPDETELSGYDLYIFDSCTPQTTPSDGAVWLINPDTAPAGMTFGATIKGTYLSAPASANAAVEKLIKSVSPSEIAVEKFTEAASYSGYETVLSCGTMPVILVPGASFNAVSGARSIVLLFDLHDTNLPMLSDFVMLVNNMINYSIPDMMRKYGYDSGEKLEIEKLPFAEKIFVQTPDGNKKEFFFDGNIAEYTVNEPGVYKIDQSISAGYDETCGFSVHIPLSESDINSAGKTAVLKIPEAGPGGNKGEKEKTGSVDIRTWLAAGLILILIAEWVVYYREQF